VRGWVDAANRIVVLTGAGISTESGIPDFRGPQGVDEKSTAEKLSNIHYYMSDPEVRKGPRGRRAPRSHCLTAKPNAGHLALAMLEKRGKLHALITQNIDELHQMAGNLAAQGDRSPRHHAQQGRVHVLRDDRTHAKALDRVRAGEDDPPCRDCGGILKSATISYGQQLVPEVIDRAFRCAREADLFLAIGTSLQVYPVASTVEIARDAGAKLVILNAEETPFDDVASAVIRDPIGAALPRLVGS
jgi:NAD-dependent deacetylase